MNRFLLALLLLCSIGVVSCSDDTLLQDRASLPDLIIESVDFQPRDPGIDEIIHINPTIRNIGSAALDLHHEEGTPFWISRHIEGSENPRSAEKVIVFSDAEEPRHLGVGEAISMPDLDFRYPGPGSTMELVVDGDWPDGPYVEELDETNNRLLLDIDEHLDSVPPFPASVTAVTPQADSSVGDTVVVEIAIENANNVAATPFRLLYNEGVLIYIDATEGDFFSSFGQTAFLATDNGGEVGVGLSLLGGIGASGGGTLAALRFEAVEAGPCGFDFTGSSVKDPQGRILPAAYTAPVVVVTPR